MEKNFKILISLKIDSCFKEKMQIKFLFDKNRGLTQEENNKKKNYHDRL